MRRKESRVRWNTLTVLSILVANCCSHLIAQELPPPQLIIPLPDAAGQPAASSTEPGRRDLAPDAVSFFRGIALLLIPSEFDDDDGWGDTTKIQSGLNMRFEDGLLRTSRRWRHVNHGNWLRASGKLVDPEETFRLHVAQLPDHEQGTKRYEVDVSARLRVTGQQQQWTHGVLLWTISAEAVTDLKLHVILDVKSQVVQTDKGTRLRFIPNVIQAEARLADYSLRRISHLKGKPVQEFGDLFENLARRRVERENAKLATRINTAIKKNAERLEIPFDFADWFGGTDSNKPTNE